MKIIFYRNKITSDDLLRAEENENYIQVVIDRDTLAYSIMYSGKSFEEYFDIWKSDYLLKPIAIKSDGLSDNEKDENYEKIKDHVLIATKKAMNDLVWIPKNIH